MTAEPAALGARPAVFLDRDGTINVKAPEGEYVRSTAELRLIEGAGQAVRRLNDAGWLVVVVTNQRGVARGLMDVDDLAAVHDAMRAQLAADGARVDAIYVCVHEAGECDCRKPRPGMLLRAAAELGIDTARSWTVGDSASDTEAGRRAGTRTVRLAPAAVVDPHADLVRPGLASAVEAVLAGSAP